MTLLVSEETGYDLLEDMFSGLPTHSSIKDIMIYCQFDTDTEESMIRCEELSKTITEKYKDQIPIKKVEATYHVIEDKEIDQMVKTVDLIVR